jgi:3-hydroxyisobutyrate dehydrogenase
MAQSALRAGHEVTGVDIDEARCRAFADSGGRISDNAAAAVATADCVVCVVVSAAQTEALLFGDDGIAGHMPAGSVFISCATVPPAFAVQSAQRLEATGRHYLDAPTSGGAGKAASGEITIMAAGSDAAFERAAPVLDATASKVYRLGAQAGAGSAMKLINQLLAGVHIASACEAMAMAIKLGLEPDTVYDVITHAAGSSWMFENRVPHILEGDYQPRSAINIFTKDLGIVLDTARSENFPVPLAGSALQMFLMAAAAGMGNDDDASVARVYAQLAGLELPKKTS